MTIDSLSGDSEVSRPIRVHLTNLAGLGAVQLASSLLPAIETSPGYYVEKLYLPSRGMLATYRPVTRGATLIRQLRVLPNSVSRFLECVVFAHAFDGQSPLLVLGDVPLRCKGKQIVFVQTPLLMKDVRSNSLLEGIKYAIARFVFRINLRFPTGFIVQTQVMKLALESTYPTIKGRVMVVGQPVPTWLINSNLHRTERKYGRGSLLHLFYPAAGYPHKNHRLLSRIQGNEVSDWPVESLTLTLSEADAPYLDVPWVRCVGILPPNEMVKAYASVDALVFLSNAESYGFPLIEAMWVGIPILCPDLPYARVLCGNQAIYFNPDDVGSLKSGVIELQTRLDSGWWPDWTLALQTVPRNWAEVARSMLAACAGGSQT